MTNPEQRTWPIHSVQEAIEALTFGDSGEFSYERDDYIREAGRAYLNALEQELATLRAENEAAEAALAAANQERDEWRGTAEVWQLAVAAANQKAALADEAYWMVELFDYVGTASDKKGIAEDKAIRDDWLARYDALSTAVEEEK